MIIGIAGPTASGKSTIAKLLEEKRGAFRIRYSMILSEIARERGEDPDDKATLQHIYLSQREIHGEDFLSKELERRVIENKSPLIVIEGNRRIVDITTLEDIAKRRKDNLMFLFIDAPIDVRFERYNNRLREHGEDPIPHEAFIELENNSAEDEIVALRDFFKKEGLLVDASILSPEEIFKLVDEHL